MLTARALRSFLVVAVLAVLAGCNASSPSPSQADLNAAHSSDLKTPTTTTSTTAASTAAKSKRGLIVKTVGQVGGVSESPDSSKLVLTFTLDKIQLDPKCTSKYADKPQRGHYLALAFTVKTTAEYKPTSSLSTLTQHDFDIVGPDGITESEVASYGSCMNNDEYLTTDLFAPASQYTGLVVLDTKNTSGAITFRPVGMVDGGGWEWTF